MLLRTSPVNWRRWATRTFETTPAANKIGLTQGWPPKASIGIDRLVTANER
ncbi:MAG TPA: hypothetical protein VIW64_14165 [Pyrinomonadaceae bacterium]